MAGVLDTLQGLENLMRELVETRSLSHNRTSVILKQMYPIYTRGLSEMSVRRYCSAHGIHKTSRLSDSQLDLEVSKGVMEV